jgi:hypothetical protein
MEVNGMFAKVILHASFAVLLLTTAIIAQEEGDEAKVAIPEGWQPLAIEIPEEFFGGTPIGYVSPNLEDESYVDREPYFAPAGVTNVALEAKVTGSTDPLTGDLEQVTDGDKHYAKTSTLELGPGTQWVQVDLGAEHEIYAVVVWHFHEGKRVYFDFVVQASNDAEFNDGVTTLYNNDHDNSSGLGAGEDKEYVEDNEGRLVAVGGKAKAQYVRCYTNGNTANENNHYVEIEVWGKKAG